MENKTLTMVFGIMLFLGVSFAGNSGNTGVEITLGGSAPSIVSVSTPTAQDPTSCAPTVLPEIQVNVSDNDGYADINLSASYVNVTKGAITHQAATCIQDSYGVTWVMMNCSGASMDFYDEAGSDWAVTAYTQDNSAVSDTMAGSDMTYNQGTHVLLNNINITFGVVYANTNDNVNTNAPPFNIQNCGNILLNSTITGANITDGGSNFIPVGQFRIDDDSTPSQTPAAETVLPELTLTESAQDYSKPGGLGYGVSETWDLYSFLNVPAAQAIAVYNTGTWMFTVYAA